MSALCARIFGARLQFECTLQGRTTQDAGKESCSASPSGMDASKRLTMPIAGLAKERWSQLPARSVFGVAPHAASCSACTHGGHLVMLPSALP